MLVNDLVGDFLRQLGQSAGRVSIEGSGDPHLRVTLTTGSRAMALQIMPSVRHGRPCLAVESYEGEPGEVERMATAFYHRVLDERQQSGGG